MSGKLTYYRTDIVEAAVKRFGKKKKLALEEVNGEFRIRTIGGPMRELWVDGVRHLLEKDVETVAGPWKTLAEAAKHFGVKPR